MPELTRRLRARLEGAVRSDPITLALYSTDASIYQIEPLAVVLPMSAADVAATIEVAGALEVPVVPRGAGTSQSGQAIGRGIVVDTSRYMGGIGPVDLETRRVKVQPGVVLDRLNAHLAQHGLAFPVDVSTSSRATLGGMAGNNSAGARSIRYGMMVDNVRALDGILADGSEARFALGDPARPETRAPEHVVERIRDIRAREEEELARRIPRVMRRVAGYNLDRIRRDGGDLVKLLVGSEGTLAFFTSIELQLAPRPEHTVIAACGFASLAAALDSVQHLVELEPSAVELVDGALVRLARGIPTFAAAVDEFVSGDPEALLLVEFSGSDWVDLAGRLDHLAERLAELGCRGAVVRAEDPAFQARIWGVRKAAMNVVMSMKGDAKPVSFIEDCTVPLEHLAEYATRLTEVFERHGTEGTWYAHASVGCLHVRPTLNLKRDSDLRKMRRIADEAHALVRELGGTHSGEHGDGLVRSEFLEPMLGPRLVTAFEEIKAAFDPAALLNPGKIVHPSRMDDRSLMRFGPDYRPLPMAPELDWSEWGGLDRAVEMCNNNGACRKFDPGVMCPSFRITGEEIDSTRGRANALRLALTGQLGREGLGSEAVHEALDLCVGCKACKRECPTGVDMARMKIEHLRAYHDRRRRRLRDLLLAYLPRYAPLASSIPRLMNAAPRVPIAGPLALGALGLTSSGLPEWSARAHRALRVRAGSGGPEVLLWLDTFSRYFDPGVASSAVRVLEAAGYAVTVAGPSDGGRPLCCGRTFLNAGMVEPARVELRRVVDSLAEPSATPIVGLEPSCLLTLRDEALALLPGPETEAIVSRAYLVEEFLVEERRRGRLQLDLATDRIPAVVVHGHCHRKAFGLDGTVTEALSWTGAAIQAVASSCCGMAGSFGYEREHVDASIAMGELSLVPAIEEAPEDHVVVADGTSCRSQIRRLTGRAALHPVEVLAGSLAGRET